MAKSVHLGLAMLSMILITAPIHSHSSRSTKEIILYSQRIGGGPNANLIPVAGPDPPRNNMFGAVSVVNFPLREETNVDSPPVGRAQGIGVSGSVDGSQSYFSISFSFDHGKFNGSTLQLQGIARFTENRVLAELSAPSGTKMFRHVSGYVQIQTVREIPAINTTIDRLKIFLRDDSY